MFSKESTIVVLAVMVIYDVTFWNETAWLRRLPGYIALSPPLLLFWQVREHLYRNLPVPQFPFVDNPLLGADFWTARMTAIKVLGKYLWLLVFPRGLSSDYSRLRPAVALNRDGYRQDADRERDESLPVFPIVEPPGDEWNLVISW